MTARVNAGFYVAANGAEMLAGGLKQHGVAVVLLVEQTGRPRIAFEFGLLPPPARVIEAAALLRARFHAEAQFRKDLFGWLDVEGFVYTPRPARGFRILLDDLAVAS